MANTGQHDGKADIHMHTVFSDGLMTPETLVEYVVHHTDLDVIAVSDHDTISGSLVAKSYYDYFADEFRPLDFIIASEVTSRDGDILALFIEHDISPKMSAEETVTAIHEQGGLAIAVHPYAMSKFLIGARGMKGVGRYIETLPFDGVEIRNGTPTELLSNFWTQWRNSQWQDIAPTGGSDTHYLRTVGGTHTRFPGRTAADLRHALEMGQTRAGGLIYNPFLALSLFMDVIRHDIPDRQLPPERAERWPLSAHYKGERAEPSLQSLSSN